MYLAQDFILVILTIPSNFFKTFFKHDTLIIPLDKLYKLTLNLPTDID